MTVTDDAVQGLGDESIDLRCSAPQGAIVQSTEAVFDWVGDPMPVVSGDKHEGGMPATLHLAKSLLGWSPPYSRPRTCDTGCDCGPGRRSNPSTSVAGAVRGYVTMQPVDRCRAGHAGSATVGEPGRGMVRVGAYWAACASNIEA